MNWPVMIVPLIIAGVSPIDFRWFKIAPWENITVQRWNLIEQQVSERENNKVTLTEVQLEETSLNKSPEELSF